MADYRSNIKDEVEVTPYRKIQNGSITGDMIKDRTITKNKLAEGVIPPINNKHNYSTEEQVVGTWENPDGTRQPLYEKTIHIAELPETGGDLNLANVDKIVSWHGYTEYWTTQFEASYSLPYFDRNLNINVVKTQNWALLINSWSGAVFKNTDITIRYTKTTDVPNT